MTWKALSHPSLLCYFNFQVRSPYGIFARLTLVATPRSDDYRGSVFHGVGVDDEREHYPICEGTSGCEPIPTRELSIQAPAILTPS